MFAELVATWRRTPVALVALVLALAALGSVLDLQIASLPLPIFGLEGHHWRQAFTYGVAWNFAHTTSDVLHPRMFVELARSNVIPMEAPLYPLLASVPMRVFSDSVVAPRVFSLFGLAATLIVLWRWLRDDETPAERAGLLLALALCPMTTVLFRSIQPEPFAAGLAVLAAAAFRRRSVLLGAAFFALSLLAKPLALGLVPALIWLAARGSGRIALKCFGALAMAVIPWALWDAHAHRLLATELNGQWVIEIVHPPKQLLRTLLANRHGLALLHHMPSYASSWFLPPAIATGLYRSLADRKLRFLAIGMMLWTVGALIEILAVAERLGSNAYYFAMLFAPLAWFAAIGLGAMVRVLDSSRVRARLVVFRAGLGCLLLLSIGAAFARRVKTTPDELGFDRNAGVWTSDLGLARLALVLIAVIALAHLFRRRVPTLLGLAGLAVCAVLVVQPLTDTREYFRWHAALDKREGVDAELARLRNLVARSVKPDERILVSPGGTYREPNMVGFACALRNGFPVGDVVSAESLEAMRARGARVLVHYEYPTRTSPPAMALGPRLGTGSFWRAFCVAADGCPTGH
jgi:hypothetical protein